MEVTARLPGTRTGVPNRLTADIREMIRGALYQAGRDCGGRGRKAGVAYLKRQAFENPKAFLGLVGKIVPAEIVTNGTPILLEQIVMLALERREEPLVIEADSVPSMGDSMGQAGDEPAGPSDTAADEAE